MGSDGISAPVEGANYKIISQTDTEKGKEFVVSFTHPVFILVDCVIHFYRYA